MQNDYVRIKQKMQTKNRATFKPIRELCLNLTNTETQEQSVKSLYFDNSCFPFTPNSDNSHL